MRSTSEVSGEPTGDAAARIWWAAQAEHDLPSGRDWLTEREQGWHESMRFPKRANEYLVARWTAKRTLSTVMRDMFEGAEPADIEIRHKKGGAPLVYVRGEEAGVEISMSDRAGWAVTAVSEGVVIGCDLELVEPRSERFVTDWLTEGEADWVRAEGEGDARHERANLVWSAKESALKVMQTGLRRDTREVEVSFPPGVAAGAAGSGWQRLTISHESGPVFPGWWQRYGAFVLTVASERPTQPPRYAGGSPPLSTAEPTHTWLTGMRL